MPDRRRRPSGNWSGARCPTWWDTPCPATPPELYRVISECVWDPAYDPDGTPGEEADAAELTGPLGLAEWPRGMRVLVRPERLHSGAQLRFEDVNGYRLTVFATNIARRQLADVQVRHRRRARCADKVRLAKGMGLQNLPLASFAQSRIWCQVIALASEITAWMGLLAHPEAPARRWEPKRLSHRIFRAPDLRPPAPGRVVPLSDRSARARPRRGRPGQPQRPADSHQIDQRILSSHPRSGALGLGDPATATTRGRQSHPDARIASRTPATTPTDPAHRTHE